MELLDTISLPNGTHLDLCRGNLAVLPRREWFDALVVSTMTADYTPTPGSVIGALARRGVSVARLAARPAIDYRTSLGMWVSEPVRTDDAGIGFGRIVCFEPDRLGSPPEVVGQFFRSMPAILDEATDIRSLAMPILSSGDRGIDPHVMLAPLLEAALAGLCHGLPLDRIAIVVREPSREISARFRAARDTVDQFDVFVSYSHADNAMERVVVQALHDVRPDIRVFVDHAELDVGMAWQPKIFESIDRCRLVIALLSPAYVASTICREEFNIAWMRGHRLGRRVLLPLYLEEAPLFTYMRAVQYADCRARDDVKVRAAVAQIARQLPA